MGALLVGHGAPSSLAQAPGDGVPAITRIGPDLANSGSWQLNATVPTNSLVTLERAASLPTRAWTPVAPPTLAPASGRLTFPIPGGASGSEQAFYRVKAEPFKLTLEDDGRSLVVEAVTPVPLGALLDALRPSPETALYAVDQSDSLAWIDPFKASGANPAAALASIGLRVWSTPPPTDDPVHSARLAGQTGPQPGALPIPPDQRGTGRVEDGFAGVSSRPVPPLGPTNAPQPGTTTGGKRFVPDLSPEPASAAQRERPTVPGPERHLRVLVQVSALGGASAIAAVAPANEAVAVREIEDLEAGDLIWVARSPLATGQPGQIYHLGIRSQPFQARAYGGPDGAPHGVRSVATARLAVPIPVLAGDTSLAGLTVEFHEVRQALSGKALTAATWADIAPRLRLLGTISGAQINAVLGSSVFAGPPGLPAPTLTTLHRSGTDGRKYNIAIIGEGFANTKADQDKFNAFVNERVMQELFRRDLHPEILNAVNVYRINTYSLDSGVSQYDENGNLVTPRQTALSLGYNGTWSRLWYEIGKPTSDAVLALWEDVLPSMDLAAVIVNEDGPGGVGGSSAGFPAYLFSNLGSDWDTFAHELGHAVGGLGDEYYCYSQSEVCDTYDGNEPGAANQTVENRRDQIKWGQWIPHWRPIPTSIDHIRFEVFGQDVGLFPGATRGGHKYWSGLYRPTYEGRMGTGTASPHNPVGYEQMRKRFRPYQEADLRKNVSGDFDGDGHADVVLHDDRQLSLHRMRTRDTSLDDPVTGVPPRPATGILEPTWFLTGTIPGVGGGASWTIRAGDQYLPADFNGDGRTDLYVVNLTDWFVPYFGMLRSTGTNFESVARYTLELPGWDDMRAHDRFQVADVDGDGRDDLLAFNGLDWDRPYFILLRSTGSSLAYVRRYERFLPGVAWAMGPNEQFLVGDFNGDGRDEVTTWNPTDWAQVTFQSFTSSGNGLTLAQRHFGVIPYPAFPLFNYTLRERDQILVLDFNGDGRDDIAVCNGRDWQTEYIALFGSQADASILLQRLHADSVPGWNLKPMDRFHAADVNGDGRDDLVVFNAANWSTEYLAILRTTATNSLEGSWQGDYIGGWNLSAQDSFRAVEFRGDGRWTDLVVYNKNVFGLLRSLGSSFQSEAIYPYHIHNHRYQRGGLW